MSHSMTITRTTIATSGSSPVCINSGYMGTTPGLLKLAQLLLNATQSFSDLKVYEARHDFTHAGYSWRNENKQMSDDLHRKVLQNANLQYRIVDERWLLGAACVGVVSYYMDNGGYRGYRAINGKAELFYLLVAVACLVGTFCLLTSCIVSLSTAYNISRTIYEVVYHGVAFILYLCAGITLLVEVNHLKDSYGRDFEPYLAAAIMGLVMAGLYLLSTFLANRQYRGI